MAALPGRLLGASQGPSSPLAHTALRTRCRQLKQTMVTTLQPAFVETCPRPGTGRALYAAPYFRLTSLVCCWTYFTHGRLRFQNVELPDCSRTVSSGVWGAELSAAVPHPHLCGPCLPESMTWEEGEFNAERSRYLGDSWVALEQLQKALSALISSSAPSDHTVTLTGLGIKCLAG